MLVQSRALSALVGQLAQNSDPLAVDLAASSSSALTTRGTNARQRLQAELSLQDGSFAKRLRQAAQRRISPSFGSEATANLMTLYFERFGLGLKNFWASFNTSLLRSATFWHPTVCSEQPTSTAQAIIMVDQASSVCSPARPSFSCVREPLVPSDGSFTPLQSFGGCKAHCLDPGLRQGAGDFVVSSARVWPSRQKGASAHSCPARPGSSRRRALVKETTKSEGLGCQERPRGLLVCAPPASFRRVWCSSGFGPSLKVGCESVLRPASFLPLSAAAPASADGSLAGKSSDLCVCPAGAPVHRKGRVVPKWLPRNLILCKLPLQLCRCAPAAIVPGLCSSGLC